MNTPVSCGRYAPSPSGALHDGNLRSALLAWLQARLSGGRFVMRMEDLDIPRTRPGSADQILSDLRWLGLDWDAGPDNPDRYGPYTQSERTAYYDAALKKLRESGQAYACYCSRKDILAAASAPHGPTVNIYPGTCRGSLDEEVPHDVSPSWRFVVPPGERIIDDQVWGEFRQDLSRDVGDFVIKRRDGLFAYQLAVVVDDAMMGVSDVLRGVDLLDSAPRQQALYEALGYESPRFWHVPLVTDESGSRLAKRDSGNLVSEVRSSGSTPARVVGDLAASLGLVERPVSISAVELLDSLTLQEFRTALRHAAHKGGSEYP